MSIAAESGAFARSPDTRKRDCRIGPRHPQRVVHFDPTEYSLTPSYSDHLTILVFSLLLCCQYRILDAVLPFVAKLETFNDEACLREFNRIPSQEPLSQIPT
jgi:hypothetical protein